MATEIIVLQQTGLPSDFTLSVLYWLTVTADRQALYANPDATSLWPGNATIPSQLAAIQAGQIVEVVQSQFFVAGTGIAAVKAKLQANFTVLQNALNAQNPFSYYGSYYDSVNGWTLVTTT